MTTENRATPLEVLQSLLAEATPAERHYLEGQVLKYARRAQSGADQAGEQPPTSAALKASADRGYQGLYWYRFELDKPDVDPYWTTFLTQQIDRYARQLGQLVSDLAAQGLAYTAPAFDPAAMAQSEQLEATRDELRALRQLQTMTMAWQERHPGHSGAAQSLQKLERQIMTLESRLAGLSSEPEAIRSSD